MGYSIRTAAWRYTRWHEYSALDSTTVRIARWADDAVAEELYQLRTDLGGGVAVTATATASAADDEEEEATVRDAGTDDYEDENLNISLPVFIIHGPTRTWSRVSPGTCVACVE